MGVSYLSASAVSTVISVIGLQWWMYLGLSKIKLDGLIGEEGVHQGNATHVLELLLGSYVTVALLLNFALNGFILLILSLKTVFFVQLYPPESRKVLECLVNYVVYKGMFLPLVVEPTIFQAALWLSWLAVLCSLKMFQSLAKDRLERLNASPSATPWTYFRIFSVLLLVFSIDLLWIKLCVLIHKALPSNACLLLFFEPFSIAFETLQAIMVHGFQLLDMWHRHSVDNSDCQQPRLLDRLVAGSFWEWKGVLTRNLGFFLDLMTLLTAVGHYLYVWWLRGVAFHFVDVVLSLIIRALVSAIVKRIKGFIKLKTALSTLHGALPDATTEELQAYNDECAICREPMVRAKKLSCNHLFHLACLKSWLDQGRSEVYSCPTCRRPLFMSGRRDYTNSRPGDLLRDEQLARQLSNEINHQSISGHALPLGAFPNQQQHATDGSVWRGVELDPSWVHSWPTPGLDGAGPSTAIRSVGLGGVQMMMRRLASVGETYAHNALDDTAWNLWPMAHTHAPSASSIPTVSSSVRYSGNMGGLHFRRNSPTANENIPGVLSMVNTVREVLPHIPDEIIFQDLQRTNSVDVTVNNLLQM
ncbi:hypothetical protein MRB53_025521 [Persea americana]|uniref:Uncharacterized protein n=1 Tax=Persea americana TaxID=3435 RepID=A0ACC2LFS3_PERAE|nr:hypothetical protein MRB53_025521 [Persea americana]